MYLKPVTRVAESIGKPRYTPCCSYCFHHFLSTPSLLDPLAVYEHLHTIADHHCDFWSHKLMSNECWELIIQWCISVWLFFGWVWEAKAWFRRWHPYVVVKRMELGLLRRRQMKRHSWHSFLCFLLYPGWVVVCSSIWAQGCILVQFLYNIFEATKQCMIASRAKCALQSTGWQMCVLYLLGLMWLCGSI